MKHLCFSLFLAFGLAETALAKSVKVTEEEGTDESVEVTFEKVAKKMNPRQPAYYFGLNLGAIHIEMNSYLYGYYDSFLHTYQPKIKGPTTKKTGLNGGFIWGKRFSRFVRADLTFDLTSPLGQIVQEFRKSIFYNYYLNVYGSFPIKDKVALFGGVGVGRLHILGKRYDGKYRSEASKFNLTYTLGADWLAATGFSLGLEWRYTQVSFKEDKVETDSFPVHRLLLTYKIFF